MLSLSLKQRARLAHALGVLYGGGVPIVRGFGQLAESARPGVRRAVKPVAAALRGGASLSEALHPQRRLLSEFFVRTMVAGERTGRLDDALAYLEAHYARRLQMYRALLQALLYPAMLVFTASVVIPAFTEFFLSNESAEVWALRSVRRGAGFFGVILFWMAVLHIAVRTGLLNVVRRNVPPMLPGGRLNYELSLGRFLYSLALMLDAGLPVPRALKEAAVAADHAFIERRAGRAAAAVERGAGLAEALVQSGVVPRKLGLQLETGEHSGRLVEILMKLSADVEEAAYHPVTVFVSLAGVVGLLAVVLFIF